MNLEVLLPQRVVQAEPLRRSASIVSGVALCPAILRATLLGTAKNSAKTSMEMIHRTTSPVRIRRIRKLSAMAGPSLRRRSRSMRGSSGVADAVAEQVERQGGDHQGDAGEEEIPPGHAGRRPARR